MPESNTPTQALSELMANCLNLSNPKSFFLFAGAGSGKTRALVEAMQMFRKQYGQDFRHSARKVAVITYTRAACAEIQSRMDYDSIFAVSTIHSFAWELIRSYHSDIRRWLSRNLEKEISDLKDKQQRGQASQASADRAVQIEKKAARLARLDSIKQFTYNPNGDNNGKNSLNHAEVISIAADFLFDVPLMRKMLIRRFPVMFIDESQDTQKDLIDAFLLVQREHSDAFCLSLFGDTMQRIYSDGKVGLDEAVPDEWEKPAITINHRCPKRIVTLINKIRSEVDDHKQEARKDAPDGYVRVFLVQDDDDIDKSSVEARIASQMAQITCDEAWTGDGQEVKTLTLEHHMAARRGGFRDFFEPLYRISRFKTGLLDGTLSGVPFFSQQVLALVNALRSANGFAVSRIIKKYSPLVSTDVLKSGKSALEEIRRAEVAVQSLFSLWDSDSDPALIRILGAVATSGLFSIPDVFAPIVSRVDAVEEDETKDSAEQSDDDPEIDAWDLALSAPFSQLESYVLYISDQSPFGTHQGIKGLQFHRVMVVLDDHEARGFMFSYDKLFGAKALTATDLENAQDGKDTSIDRTRRLFYVACSRAQSSLAIVVYTREKGRIVGHLQDLGWFDETEIIDFK